MIRRVLLAIIITLLPGVSHATGYPWASGNILSAADLNVAVALKQYGTIDATQSSGADMCAKISAAAVALNVLSPGGGTIDARGFTGSQTCAGSMFASWPGGGFWSKLILGAVQITTNVSQRIPTRTWVSGTSPFNDSISGGQSGGTAFIASASFPTSTPVIDLGAPTQAFSIHLDHVAVDCSAKAGSIGVKNQNAQEATVVDHITVRGCYTAVQISGPNFGDTNEFSNLTMTDTGLSGTSYVCLRIGAAADSDNVNQVIWVHDISCGSNATTATNLVLIDCHTCTVERVYLEGQSGAVTNGVNIGSQSSGGLRTRNVKLSSVYCGGSTGETNCVTLSSGINGPVTVEMVQGGTTNLINDTLSGGCVIPVAQETALGLYARGYTTRIVNNSAYCPKP